MMDMREFQEKLEQLMELAAKQEKNLNNEQILEIFGLNQLSPQQLQSLYEYLRIQGIRIQGADLSPMDIGKALDPQEEQEEEKKPVILEAEDEQCLKEYEEMLRQFPSEKEGEREALLLQAVTDVAGVQERLAQLYLKEILQYARKLWRQGIYIGDLIQEGNMGLMKAVEKFDYKKGNKFSTYSTWWIRQAITRGIADTAKTIRVPVHMVETINKTLRTSRMLLQELGREPTNEEIAKKMNMPVAKIDEILKTSRDPVSLDTPIGEEEDSQLGDFIEDESLLSPVDSASFSMLKEELEEAMASLTERERNVIKLRFGLDDGKTRTLEEVGKEFNVTRERIRQIEAKALRKLRHPSRSRKLRDYLD